MNWEVKKHKIKAALGQIWWGFYAYEKEYITMWGCHMYVTGGLRDLGWQLTHCWPTNK